MAPGGTFELLEASGPHIAGGTAAPGVARFRTCREVSVGEFLLELTRSKAAAARVLAAGSLYRKDGVPLARTALLAAGEELALALVPTHAAGPAAEGQVELFYEDPFLLVANKPAGILVHGDGTEAETLTARVQGHLLREGSAAVPQALNRLDVETSGIVLFSLAEETQPAFDALVAGDGVRKRYYALVEGRLPRHEGEWLVVDAPIARDRHDARRMRVGRTGKPSRTLLREADRRGSRTLVEAELATGRRHQIRVHLAHLGCPIVGDALYGGARAERMMLHAHELRMVHPLTGKELLLEAPCPW